MKIVEYYEKTPPFSCVVPHNDIYLFTRVTSGQQKNYANPPHPYKDPSFICSGMILHNLLEIEWVSTTCHSGLSQDIFCVHKNPQSTNPQNSNHTVSSCKQGEIIFAGFCYIFSQSDTVNQNKICTKSSFQEPYFEVLLLAIDPVFPPIFTCNFTTDSRNKTPSNIVQHKLKKSELQWTLHRLYPVCFVDRYIAQTARTGGNTFQCAAHLMSISLVCSKQIHCSNKNLDFDCPKGPKTKTQINSNVSPRCTQWYYSFVKGSCVLPFPVQTTPSNKANPKSDHTVGSKTLQQVKQFDSGIMQPWLGMNFTHQQLAEMGTRKCSLFGLLQCSKFSNGCFHVSHICILIVSELGSLLPCSNGGHIQNCEKFECNAMFKCPGFYCVQWSKVCDGMWDCPKGTDESKDLSCQLMITCTNMFKCGYSHQCIHLGNVCDGNKDCPFQDDELWCTLSPNKCPKNCKCVIFAVGCFNAILSNDTFTPVIPFQTMIIQDSIVSHCTVSNHSNTGNVSHALITFKITNSSISDLCIYLYNTRFLFTLDASANKIAGIKQRCFGHSLLLRAIQLSSNNITFIQQHSLVNLTMLFYLNLSHNPLHNFHDDQLSSFNTLVLLSLENCSLTDVIGNAFSHSRVKLIVVNKYKICCIVPKNINCSEPIPWYVACQGILPTLAIKILFYVISACVLSLNILSIVIQICGLWQKYDKSAAFPAVVISVNVSDMTLSFPLFILWASDLKYKETLILDAEKWRANLTCLVVFFFSLFFILLSPTISCLLSLSRLMVTKHPVDSKFKEFSFIKKNHIWNLCVYFYSNYRDDSLLACLTRISAQYFMFTSH